jgi:hypothetical protein
MDVIRDTIMIHTIIIGIIIIDVIRDTIMIDRPQRRRRKRFHAASSRRSDNALSRVSRKMISRLFVNGNRTCPAPRRSHS